MRNRFQVVAVLLLVLLPGLHWALLQTVAWTGMLLRYSREAPFRDAVTMTFDGKHPCSLCDLVEAGRSEQGGESQHPVPPTTKLDLGLVWDELALIPVSDRERIPWVTHFAPSRNDAPPKPRPRQCIPGFRPADV
jgi:hypothetical protein